MMNLQLFATRGYAVFLPDAPQKLGTPMLDLAKTVLPGVNKVIEIGIADPERLGVIGHSFGGYSVLTLIVQTNRFKVAMAADGFADMISAYGEMGRHGETFEVSSSEHGQGLMGSTPWEYRERYEENSPFLYLDRLQTPTLLVHGSADEVVAPFLSDQVFVRIRRLNKVVEYAKYENEEHSPSSWSYAKRVDLCERTIARFDRYLLSGHSPIAETSHGFPSSAARP